MKDLIKLFQELPPYVTVTNAGKKYEFHLCIIPDGHEDTRLCYDKFSGDFDDLGAWENPYLNNQRCGFLYLVEGIRNESEMREAILETMRFLNGEGLNPPDKK